MRRLAGETLRTLKPYLFEAIFAAQTFSVTIAAFLSAFIALTCHVAFNTQSEAKLLPF
jgi:hypothetical protein